MGFARKVFREVTRPIRQAVGAIESKLLPESVSRPIRAVAGSGLGSILGQAAGLIPGVGTLGSLAINAATNELGGRSGGGGGLGSALGYASGLFGGPGGGLGGLVEDVVQTTAPTSTGLGALGSLALGGLDAYQQYQSAKDLEEDLMGAQRQAEAAISPYTQAGGAAQQQLAERLQAGFDPGDLTADPGYQFRLQEANRALDRRLAAGGGLESGRALRAAQELGQGLAAQEYRNAYNRWLQQNQQLAGAGSRGQQAARQLGNIYTQQGNIRAQRTLGQGNVLGQALSGLGSRLMDDEMNMRF